MNVDSDIVLPEGLQWNVKTVATCAAIVLIMIVNIIALIFTIFWCLRTKDDAGEFGSNGVSANQFVEPNIRMKLKLPKIRGDIIQDSSEDVFELRVPRNGNQFNACHEQTVIVSRDKRRRTYSVPLESRPRTQSTSSQQFNASEV